MKLNFFPLKNYLTLNQKSEKHSKKLFKTFKNFLVNNINISKILLRKSFVNLFTALSPIIPQ